MNVGEAFGRPGVEPRWARSNKDGVGTAYSAASRLWFTLWRGIVTEVYYPTIDRPQLRDLQYLVSDGTFLHEEKRDLEPTVEWLASGVPGYRVRSRPPDGSYTLEKEIISDPHVSCLLMRTALRDAPEGTRLYALCAPHLEVGGLGNHAEVVEVAGRRLLAAHKGGTWLVLGASIPFAKMSCGYVGASDGWSDLTAHGRMEWEFTEAHDGNLALTGELDPATEFTLGMAAPGRHRPVRVAAAALRGTARAVCAAVGARRGRAAAPRQVRRGRRAALPVERVGPAQPRGQDLSGRAGRLALHPLGRGARGRRHRRLPPGVDP
jgi:glucoamylase